MITFSNITPEDYQEYTAVRDITITCGQDASLDELLDAFKGFLQASGYIVNGNIVIEEPEDSYTITVGDTSVY